MRIFPEYAGRLIGGWMPALLCGSVIFYLSAQPSSALPSPWFPHMDKLAHAAEYGVLAILLFRAWFWPKDMDHDPREKKFIPLLWAFLWPRYKGLTKIKLFNAGLVILLVCSLYALSDEIHQMYVPGRAAAFPDWMADFLGSGLALALCLYLTYPWQREKISPPLPLS